MKICDHCGKKATQLDYSLQTREPVLFTYDLCDSCQVGLDAFLVEAVKLWQTSNKPLPPPAQIEGLRQLNVPRATKEPGPETASENSGETSAPESPSARRQRQRRERQEPDMPAPTMPGMEGMPTQE
jgi:hypothetical protein